MVEATIQTRSSTMLKFSQAVKRPSVQGRYNLCSVQKQRHGEPRFLSSSTHQWFHFNNNEEVPMKQCVSLAAKSVAPSQRVRFSIPKIASFLSHNMHIFAVAMFAVLIGLSMVACSDNGDNDYYAQYTLTFDNNGGVGTPPNSKNIQGGNIVTLPGNTNGMINDTAVFNGWNTSPVGMGTHYNIGADFTMPNKDITLYAQWNGRVDSREINDYDQIVPSYTLTFDNNGGVGTPPNTKNVQGGNIVTLPGNTNGMTNDTAVFNGWNTSPVGMGTHYNIGADFTMPNKDIILYAQWNDRVDTQELRKPTEMNKFVAEQSPYIGNDKIKYSYSYDGYDMYYLHIGKMKANPLFFYPAQHHNGMNSTYKISSTEITTTKITETITSSIETIINVVDTHTKSTTTGGKISAEIKADVKFLFGLIKLEGPRAADELYRNDYVYSSTNKDFRQTTSLTNTLTRGTEYTKSITTEREWNFTKNDKVGYYRYTLFSVSDVYLYVVRDSKTGAIDYEFREFVIADSLRADAWVLDYSENGEFEKSDTSSFKFDVSMLNNLPKPTLIMPSAPSNVSAIAQSPSSITISWNTVLAADSYEIFRSTSTNETYISVGTSTSTSYTDTGLESGKEYFYKVTAVNNSGAKSIYSSVISAKTKSTVEITINETFTAAGNHGNFIFDKGVPAKVKVYLLGGGGGGQGGHDHQFSSSNGRGGGGGSGAAIAMELNVTGPITFENITVGGSGSGGSCHYQFAGGWQSGNPGYGGGTTSVTIGTTTISAGGGGGGGGTGTNLSQGSRGVASSRPSNIAGATIIDYQSTHGNAGTDGNRASSSGGSGGSSVFVSGYSVGSGKGGNGGYQCGLNEAKSQGGGIGRVVILITYLEEV